MKHTPIFICAKDRASMLKALVDRLEGQGYDNLIIVDTGSTWKPMLEYEAGLKWPIHRVSAAVMPHMALWSCHVLDKAGCMGKRYAYTDCDVVPDDGCPDDWLERLSFLLDAYPTYIKAGLGLRIDDLPGHYQLAQKVRDWESRFWKKEIEPDVYEAEIDTTMALYREGHGGFGVGLRTGGKYMARHLPWYSKSRCLSEEEVYYQLHRKTGTW